MMALLNSNRNSMQPQLQIVRGKLCFAYFCYINRVAHKDVCLQRYAIGVLG